MNKKYQEVLDDILTLISSLHYDDKDKEYARAEIYYFIFKACETEKEMRDNCLILDRYKIANKK